MMLCRQPYKSAFPSSRWAKGNTRNLHFKLLRLWREKMTNLNLLNGLFPLTDDFQILLRDFRQQGLILVLVLPRAISPVKDLLIIRYVREGGPRALLWWENGKQARKCQFCPVLHSFLLGKENSNIIDCINSGGKVKGRRVRTHIKSWRKY